MRRGFTCALFAAAAAGIALSAAGLPRAGATVTTARSPIPLVYSNGRAGYVSSGRSFRFASVTVTVPPRTLPAAAGSSLFLTLQNTARRPWPLAFLTVRAGGGAGGVGWSISDETLNVFAMSPRPGDRLRASIRYDRRGHTEFTAADLTQGVTRTARVDTGDIVYNEVLVYGFAANRSPVPPPPADMRIWAVTGARITTDAGVRGTMTGPWTTRAVIDSSTGTSAGRVVESPSGLGGGGASFGVWLRALPVSYTPAFAGYAASGGRFRYVATTLTVPPRPAAAGRASLAYIELSHRGGPTPRPYAYLRIRPGGGEGSVRFDSLGRSGSGLGTLPISPRAGDRLAISIGYDRRGHLRFTATDLATGATAAATTAAMLARVSPYNRVSLLAELTGRQASAPPADVRLWRFAGTRITTYSGHRGSTLGPWATGEQVDTADGTAAGAVLMSPSPLSDGGRAFGIWLRHH